MFCQDSALYKCNVQLPLRANLAEWRWKGANARHRSVKDTGMPWLVERVSILRAFGFHLLENVK